MAECEIELEEGCAKLNKALAQYYINVGKTDEFYPDGVEKDSIFAQWVDDNGFDDDTLESEIVDDPSEATVVEFHVDDDDNIIFPLKPMPNSKPEKMKKILGIIKECYKTGNPPLMNVFDVEELQFSAKDAEIKKLIERYKKQVPQIASTVTKENDVMYFLATSVANNGFPVLPLMVDSFTRCRIQRKITEDETIEPNHFVEQNVDKIIKTDKKEGKKLDLAIKAYCARIVPFFQFAPMKAVNDSVGEIINYVASLSQLVKDLVTKSCPFQADITIFVKSIKETSNLESPDDSSEDEDDDTKLPDKKEEEIDLEIEKRLKKEKIAYNKITKDNKYDYDSINKQIKDLFKKFKQNKSLKANADYPKKKRFCIYVKRHRSKSKNDEIIILSPPGPVANIPDDHVNEWYFESSRRCIIPRIGYGDGSKELFEKKDEESADEFKKDATISSQSAIGGYLMTFSFHAENKNKIKCYMYWMQQTLRFYPQDIYEGLRFIFSKKKMEAFTKNEGNVNKMMNLLHIQDGQFEKFYKSLNKKEIFPKSKFEGN